MVRSLYGIMMAEVSQWAIMAIVKAAVPRILLMLNPAGAIAQIIAAIVKTVIWFKNNFARIAKWANTVFESVVDIAGGAVGAAATKVEQSMAQAIPVILAFLAEQLGLGNISQGIQNALEKIRKPVDKIVAWIADKAKRIIAKIKRMFGKDKPEAGVDPAAPNPAAQRGPNDTEVGRDITFKAGAETHHLWIDTAGGGARVMIASKDPKPVPDKLNDWKAINDKKDNDDPEKIKMTGIINEARGKHRITLSDAQTAEKQMKEAENLKTPKENQEATELDVKVERDETALVSTLKEGFEKITNKTEGPRPILTEKTIITGGGKSGEATAFPVTNKVNGNKDRTDIPAWEHAQKLNAAKGEDGTGAVGRKGDWVKGHIITWRMGGDGTLQSNIFIIDRSANGNMSTHENNAHRELERIVNKPTEDEIDKVMFYKVKYDYWGEKEPLNGFANNIIISYGTSKIDGSSEIFMVKGARVKSTEPPLDTSEVIYNLDNIGWSTLVKLTKDKGIIPAFAQNLTRIRNKNDKFGNLDNLTEDLIAFHNEDISLSTVKTQLIIIRSFVSDDLKFKL